MKEVMEIINWIDKNNLSPYLINAREIKKWMEERNTVKPPSKTAKDAEEKRLGNALSRIRTFLIKPYKELTSEESIKNYKEKHPELEEVLEIVKWIDENNLSEYLINAREIKKWMQARNVTKPPSARGKDAEEKRLGQRLATIRRQLIKPYIELKTEKERERFKEEHPELEEILEIVNWIDENNLPIKLVQAREIKKWMKDRNTIKPPSLTSKDAEEKKLGSALATIRSQLIKPYIELKTEEERKEYKEEHPELEEILEIVNWIDENSLPIYLKNAREIKKWMEDRNTVKPPSQAGKDEEEKRLGRALNGIRFSLINPYMELETEEAKEEYKEEHPELEEVMKIVNWIDENNLSTYLKNAREIKKWMKERNTTKPPACPGKDAEEKRLGNALSSIRSRLIKPYKELTTEEQREKYKEEHPELEEVMEIINWIDENNLPIYLKNAREIKKWMEDRNVAIPPSQHSKDEEEKKLGNALTTIRRQLIKPYKELTTEEQREKYKEKHPELEEVMEIVEWIDENNPKKIKAKDIAQASFSIITNPDEVDNALKQVENAAQSLEDKNIQGSK